MVGFDLMIKDGFASPYQLLLGTRLIANFKVDCRGELMRKLEVDDFVFSFEGLLQEILDHLEGLAHEVAFVLRVDSFLVHKVGINDIKYYRITGLKINKL
jgi:hypothetical protein